MMKTLVIIVLVLLLHGPTTSARPPTRSNRPPTRSARPPTRSNRPPTNHGRPPAHRGRPPTKSVVQPNFVMLYVDDMGYGDLGCFGNRTSRTPNIDKLAQEGVKFTQMLSAAPICTPSRAALLTSRLPVRMGMSSSTGNFRTINSPAQPSGLPHAEITWAEALRGAGYATAAVGKWHLGTNDGSRGSGFLAEQNGGHLPIHHGFDSFYGMPVTNVQSCGKVPIFHQSSTATFMFHRFALQIIIGALTLAVALFKGWAGRGTLKVVAAVLVIVVPLAFHFTTHYTLLTPKSCLLYRNDTLIEQPVRLPGLTQRLTAEASRFIHEHKAKPFFLYFGYVKLHTALFTHPDFRGRSGKGDFVDNVEELDWSVGEVMKALREAGVADNTVVYLSSDNGPYLERGHEAGTPGEVADADNNMVPLRGGKGQTWEGGIRVPGIAWWPSRIAPRTVGQAVSTMDLFPTSMALANLPMPSPAVTGGARHDGRDLSPLLLSREAPNVDAERVMVHYCGADLSAVRYGRYKLHFRTTKWEDQTSSDRFHCKHCCPLDIICPCGGHVHHPPLLFDLHADPGESTPLDHAQHREAVDHIMQAVEQHREELNTAPQPRNQLEVLARPWLQPCCGPTCRCCTECNEEEEREHEREWEGVQVIEP